MATLTKESELGKVTITKESDLFKAIKEEQDTIEIEGDLAKKVVRIKVIGKVAWAVALGAMGLIIALFLVLTVSGAAAPSIGLVMVIGALALLVPAAVTLGGGPAFASAILIALAGGEIGVLNSLRKYKITEQSKTKCALVRK
ncbi:MAG: hypothetical protein LBS60_10495 [Deltaproteobacteria bacterium]|nr:hypothetical protein [Deltaproteobacteria bacterium]